jgi:hypothetical protein
VIALHDRCHLCLWYWRPSIITFFTFPFFIFFCVVVFAEAQIS